MFVLQYKFEVSNCWISNIFGILLDLVSNFWLTQNEKEKQVWKANDAWLFCLEMQQIIDRDFSWKTFISLLSKLW